MSKIMSISGNFEQFGKWSEPDPGFTGLIILQDDGNFEGYLEELYGTVAGLESLHNDNNRLRFIAGFLRKTATGKDGIIFIKLSADTNQSPLLYVAPDLKEEGEWAAPGFSGFSRQGSTKVLVTEATDFLDEKTTSEKISDVREKALRLQHNTDLYGQIDSCRSMLENISYA